NLLFDSDLHWFGYLYDCVPALEASAKRRKSSAKLRILRTDRTTDRREKWPTTQPIRAQRNTELLTNAKLADDIHVSLSVDATQIIEQTAAATDHRQQPAATGVILLVRPHVLGQVVDPRRENG